MNDNFQEFIDRLRIEEDKVLAEKTSWGRNELKIALEAAKTNTVISMLNQQVKSDDAE
jgi:hypothetical protein